MVSPSLRSLELSTTRARQFSPFGYATAPVPDNDYTQSEPLFVGLPSAAPHLSRLFISSRHLPRLIVLPHLLRFSQMRELYLYSNLCSLTPLDLHRLFEAMPILELLSTHIRDFDSPDHVASSDTLRELRVNGAGGDLAGLLTHGLQAPYLHSLLVTIDEDVWTPSHDHCIKALSDRQYISCLRKLKIATQTYGDEPPIQPSLPLYPTVVHPLSALRGLEALDLGILHTLFRLEEVDILAIAQAWPRMKSLVLSYIPSDSLPSISALRHFAEHCPDLRGLTLTKLNLTGIGDLQDQIPASYASRPPHPLQKLDLRMTWGVTPAVSGEAAQSIARFLDTLFPNVQLRERRPDISRIDSFFVSWERIETEIRALRNERTMDLVAWREAHTTMQGGTR
ncbi:hypothetical protein BN946_scf184757.g11 [Trametes cinnabarina]|uniref:F-box domain-containing protein n=1 Tax=Pycnoporus cinnabarinus TaxID=5643 RepID=A0A060SLJ2_PYCCI|nr:hypothetical protein BN946_scf184757.g11 [Trametes cinnabarina]